MYNNKSSIYENFNVDLNNQLINTTEWENNKYLYPIHITSEGKIQTSISLSNETITSGEDMVATLIDETGNPLSGKTVYFRNADNLTFATVVTDKFGHARQTFNMAEVKNKIMYYGWESDDDLYEGVENVAHITINRRSLCFVENNINADDTVPVGFIYKNRLVDCRDYSNGLVDTADYGRSMYGKVVSIIFERFKKDTMESLGKSAPYYILINREDGRFEFPINLAPSGVNGEYHYTFELNYDYDLNDREYRNIDGYYNDKQTYPIKFYTETVEDNSKKVNMSLSAYPSEVSKGTQYTLTCHLAPSTEAINEGKTVNNIKGYVLFKTEQGAYLNKDNPTVVNKGIASFVGIDNATSGQDFIINAEFISTDVLMFNDCESTDTVTITTIEEGENSNKNTKTTITDITPNSGATGDTFTVTTTVVTRNNNENIPNGTITLTGFDGNIVETGTITDGIGTISATVPNVLKKTYTDLIVEYKGEGYNASSSTPNQFTVTASPISGDRYNISWQKEIDNEITSDEAENYEYTVYLINTSPTFYDPSGQVEVYLDGVYIETLNIINMGAVGKVTSTINLNDGESNHLLRFEYLGDDYFLPSTTSHLIGITQTSNQTTTPTISINGTNNITSGDNYDVTITVTGDATNGAPTGTITLDKNNNSNIYNLQLTPTSGTTSTATFTESSSGDTSTVKFRAYYNSGDTSKYTDAGYSDYFNVTITSSTVTKANSSISLTGTSPISQGTNYTLTATVTGNSTTGYPTGNVELYKGGNKLDTASLSRYNNSSSKVTFTPSSSGDTGTKTFKAKYLGNTVYNSTGYSDNVNIQVEQPTTLTMSNYTIKSGTTGTVQAILTDNNGTRLSGKTVNIQIAGVTYSMTSVGNGVYEKTINMTGNRNGTMKATFNGETGVYQSSSSKTCSIIIYQNRVGYGNLWVLYPDSFSKGSALNFYVVDSNQNPLSGYPVSIKYTRINTSTTYPWSDTTTQNTAYTGLVSSATVSYDWSNATLQFNVTFNSSIAVVSMGEGGSLSNLPNGNSVTFNVSYNPS